MVGQKSYPINRHGAEVERLRELFEEAFQHFISHYQISPSEAALLKKQLSNVPKDLAKRERRLMMGYPADATDVVFSDFGRLLMQATKRTRFQAPPQERDALRKRLKRTGSSILRPLGPKKYAYTGLEAEYALAISRVLPKRPDTKPKPQNSFALDEWLGDSAKVAKLLGFEAASHRGKRPRAFPYSRRTDNSFSGPAFNLLIASLSMALPHTGADSPAATASRLDRLIAS